MDHEKNKPAEDGDLNPFPDEAWIGCPHCENGIDICAPIARARREVGEFVLSLIMNGVQAEHLTAPLERLNQDCMDLEDRIRRSVPPLAHLNVYERARPRVDGNLGEEEGADTSDGQCGGKEPKAQGMTGSR